LFFVTALLKCLKWQLLLRYFLNAKWQMVVNLNILASSMNEWINVLLLAFWGAGILLHACLLQYPCYVTVPNITLFVPCMYVKIISIIQIILFLLFAVYLKLFLLNSFPCVCRCMHARICFLYVVVLVNFSLLY
jgi:hypothetical protein